MRVVLLDGSVAYDGLQLATSFVDRHAPGGGDVALLFEGEADVPVAHLVDLEDAEALYDKLFEVVLPLFADRERWVEVMRSAVALNASYFNAHRMAQQYVTSSWLD